LSINFHFSIVSGSEICSWAVHSCFVVKSLHGIIHAFFSLRKRISHFIVIVSLVFCFFKKVEIFSVHTNWLISLPHGHCSNFSSFCGSSSFGIVLWSHRNMIIKNRFGNFADIEINGIRTSITNLRSLSNVLDWVVLNCNTIVVSLWSPPSLSFCLNVILSLRIMMRFPF